jgi:glycosyltransferase involved in cell wall biosynthesis
MKVLLVLPRHMHFTSQRATSIDLCAYELLLHSRYRAETRVVCAEEAEYLPDVDVAPFPARIGSVQRIRAISREVKRFAPDIIVVHQHLRTVFLLSLLHPSIPIVLHRHNYYSAKLTWMSRLVYHAYWRRISAVFFVSEHCKSGFLSHSDYARSRTFVVPNGLDFSTWSPAATRDKTVMFAGRSVPEKGALEAARATAIALVNRPEWRARFFISQPEKNPRYTAEVQSALAPLGDRGSILSNVPFEQVKSGFETAALALVPSIWNEPFGRTALEAMAGGAALICSGRGGLAEVIGVSGEGAALRVEPTADAIQGAIERLLEDDSERAAIAAAGQARARRRFSIQQIADTYDRYLETIVRETQSLGRKGRP